MPNTLRILLVPLLVLSLAACDDASSPATATPAVRAYCGADTDAIERRIDRLLGQLTLEQKTTMVRGDFVQSGLWASSAVESPPLGPILSIDGPRGVSKFVGKATAFPVAMARGASFDPALERRVGEAIGREALAYGATQLLAPTMNVLRHPRWGRAQETYGEDPFHIGRMAAGFVGGAQEHVMATAKHYAANSIENTRTEVDVTIDERTLREIYLPHFRHVVEEAHVASVMSAYNSVNGAFCSQNPHLIRDILKTEWQFAGFVVSDWVWGTHETVPAALAGLDLEMPVEKIYGTPLLQAVQAGEVDVAIVDEMVRRLLRASFCHGFGDGQPTPDPSQIELPATRDLAREAAERSFVLLKNQGNTLPLARTAGHTIVVTGPLADVENIGDAGSSAVTPSSVVTALEGLVAAGAPADVVHLGAPPSTPSEQMLVANADAVIVVVGLTTDEEGEAYIGAGDRASLAMPASHEQWILSLAALSNKVVVVVEGGSAITMDGFLGSVEAVLHAWYPGVEGGTALANVLYGVTNPSGRLPLVFPHAEADLPPFDNTSLAVTYGPYHGYRHLDHTQAAPLFPFGFGLSYTTFAYANLALESTTLAADGVLRASVDVTNTGSVAGRETVQLYVGEATPSATTRYVRELRGFAQVDLAPGATARVTLAVPVSELGFFDAELGAFRVTPTSYRVEVGSSSRDLPLSATLDVTP